MKYLTVIKISILVIISVFISQCKSNTGQEKSPVYVKIETAMAKNAVFYNEIKGYGTIEAQYSLDLETKFDGIVHFENLHGKIKKGEIIYTLSGTEVELKKENLEKSLAVAETQFEYAKQYYDAQKKLHSGKYVARLDFEKATRDFENVQNNLNTVRYELKYFYSMINYRAPFSGYLDHIQVPQGEDAVAGQVLGTFQDDDHLKLVAPFYGNLKLLKTKRVNLIINNKRYSGTLTYKEEAINPATGGHTLWIAIENPRDLNNGDYVSYSFLLNEHSAVSVPMEAIVQQNNQYFVIVPAEGHYKKIPVTTGIEQERRVEILSGIKPGTKVVTKGSFEIFYGNLEETMKIADYFRRYEKNI